MTQIDRSKIRRLDGTLLLVFRELVRCGRTTAAAERLGLSQSAVSHALGRLRDLFDDPLFVRRSDGLNPTRHALEIAPLVDDLIRRAQKTIDIRSSFDARTTSRVFRLSSPDCLYLLTAGRLLRAFEQLAPKAVLTLPVLMAGEAVGALLRDEIDVAIGKFKPQPETIHTEVLFREGYCAVARTDHPAVRGTLTRGVYEQCGHVVVRTPAGLAGVEENALRTCGIQRRIAITVPRFIIALTVVAESEAIATVPERFAQRYAAPFGLQVLPLPFELPDHPVVALRRADAEGDAAIDWLIERVKEASAC